MDNTRIRILEEVQRLRAEIYNCDHCAALRDQIVRLVELMPPEPIKASDGLWYVFNPPPELQAMMDARLKQLLPDIGNEMWKAGS